MAKGKVSHDSEMPLTAAFYKRSTELLNSMRGRFKEKVNKRGKVIREGRIVPVELDEMRNWIERQLGGKPDGAGRCFYCQAPIDAMNIGIDHGWPASLGGSLGPSNWYPVATDCDCNRVKGKMNVQEFQAFLQFCRMTLSAVAEKDVRDRLKMGEGFRRMRFFPRDKKKAPETAPSVPEQATLPDDF